jgi:hypothetical protein
MKQLLLAAAMLLTFGFTARAITVIDNQTNCNVDVTQICYDAACNPISTTMFSIAANSNFSIPPPLACPAGTFTSYTVCWNEPGCTGTCVTVEGSAVPVCSTGPYNAPLPSCGLCSPFGATVNYDLVNDILTIF